MSLISIWEGFCMVMWKRRGGKRKRRGKLHLFKVFLSECEMRPRCWLLRRVIRKSKTPDDILRFLWHPASVSWDWRSVADILYWQRHGCWSAGSEMPFAPVDLLLGGSGRQWRVHRSRTYITIKAAQHGTSCFQRLLLGCIWCISANYGQTAELSAATHREARLHLISDICSRRKATIMYIISLYSQSSTD